MSMRRLVVGVGLLGELVLVRDGGIGLHDGHGCVRGPVADRDGCTELVARRLRYRRGESFIGFELLEVEVHVRGDLEHDRPVAHIDGSGLTQQGMASRAHIGADQRHDRWPYPLEVGE